MQHNPIQYVLLSLQQFSERDGRLHVLFMSSGFWKNLRESEGHLLNSNGNNLASQYLKLFGVVLGSFLGLSEFFLRTSSCLLTW